MIEILSSIMPSFHFSSDRHEQSKLALLTHHKSIRFPTLAAFRAVAKKLITY